MRQDRRLMKQAFGVNEWNFADLPTKISNVRLAWIFHTLLGGLVPQRPETTDREPRNNFRSWRFYRHRPYKIRPAAPIE
jgi:hypothetical protein